MATRRIVGYTRGEQRRDRRRQTVVGGVIDGIRVRLHDISHSGVDVEIEDIEVDLARWAVGQTCALLLEGSGIDEALDLRIARIDADSGHLGAKFEAITDEQYKLIEQLVLRGRV